MTSSHNNTVNLFVCPLDSPISLGGLLRHTYWHSQSDGLIGGNRGRRKTQGYCIIYHFVVVVSLRLLDRILLFVSGRLPFVCLFVWIILLFLLFLFSRHFYCCHLFLWLHPSLIFVLYWFRCSFVLTFCHICSLFHVYFFLYFILVLFWIVKIVQFEIGRTVTFKLIILILLLAPPTHTQKKPTPIRRYWQARLT